MRVCAHCHIQSAAMQSQVGGWGWKRGKKGSGLKDVLMLWLFSSANHHLRLWSPPPSRWGSAQAHVLCLCRPSLIWYGCHLWFIHWQVHLHLTVHKNQGSLHYFNMKQKVCALIIHTVSVQQIPAQITAARHKWLQCPSDRALQCKCCPTHADVCYDCYICKLPLLILLLRLLLLLTLMACCGSLAVACLKLDWFNISKPAELLDTCQSFVSVFFHADRRNYLMFARLKFTGPPLFPESSSSICFSSSWGSPVRFHTLVSNLFNANCHLDNS